MYSAHLFDDEKELSLLNLRLDSNKIVSYIQRTKYKGFVSESEMWISLPHFESLAKKLSLMYETLVGEARFYDAYEPNGFAISMQAHGHIRIESYMEHNGPEYVQVKIGFISDQTQLLEFKQQIEIFLEIECLKG